MQWGPDELIGVKCSFMIRMRTVLYTVDKNDLSMAPKMSELASPITVRSCPSLVNFRGKFLFISGGYDPTPV